MKTTVHTNAPLKTLDKHIVIVDCNISRLFFENVFFSDESDSGKSSMSLGTFMGVSLKDGLLLLRTRKMYLIHVLM